MSVRPWIAAAALCLIATVAAPPVALAQSFGIGPRISFVHTTGDDNEDSQRFSGGVFHLGGGRSALEVAMDYRSALTGDLTERITNIPIQVSWLVYPVRSSFSPYLLFGVGWYSQNVKRFSSVGATTPIEENTTRRRGYHGGLGGELRVHRRVGLHGDYRYTFLRFGDEDRPGSVPRLIPFAESLKIRNEGSMFTWGATFYF
jgi:hypothetical protein